VSPGTRVSFYLSVLKNNLDNFIILMYNHNIFEVMPHEGKSEEQLSATYKAARKVHRPTVFQRGKHYDGHEYQRTVPPDLRA
jgi:hypothetical protein